MFFLGPGHRRHPRRVQPRPHPWRRRHLPRQEAGLRKRGGPGQVRVQGRGGEEVPEDRDICLHEAHAWTGKRITFASFDSLLSHWLTPLPISPVEHD